MFLVFLNAHTSLLEWTNYREHESTRGMRYGVNRVKQEFAARMKILDLGLLGTLTIDVIDSLFLSANIRPCEQTMPVTMSVCCAHVHLKTIHSIRELKKYL